MKLPTGRIPLLAVAILLVGGMAPARTAERPWSAVRRLSAPEAVQAAAADESFVYAVSSTTVAKYDRATGRRLAVSTGRAQHLNSGFLDGGKLYCAHSNYPRVPEQSELMVLDPQSMHLSTFHDFGDAGGSLTWAVRVGDAWWCNFARYGTANRETRLVKFDLAWRERSRYRYPEDVLKRLGRYSLSGGIWRGDELWVTGHDDPVVFRLRLPSAGDVLELVGETSVPFTGQGIAADPKTGGLVGISRKNREVIFAEPK